MVQLPHDLVKLVGSHRVHCARDGVEAGRGAASARHILSLGRLDWPRCKRGERRAACRSIRGQLHPQEPSVHLKVVEHAYRVIRKCLFAEFAVSESFVLPHVVADEPRHPRGEGGNAFRRLRRGRGAARRRGGLREHSRKHHGLNVVVGSSDA